MSDQDYGFLVAFILIGLVTYPGPTIAAILFVLIIMSLATFFNYITDKGSK